MRLPPDFQAAYGVPIRISPCRFAGEARCVYF